MFDEGTFTVEHRQGDLLELEIAGIVCNVNVELDLNYKGPPENESPLL